MNRNPWNCLKVKRHQFENSAKSIWVEGKIKMKQLNMYLLTFLMFSLTAIAQGSNRLSEPDFKAANFAKAIEDRKLNGSVLRDFEVASEISCQFECISEERCLSYNFLPIHGKEISICQLSDSDRFISSVNFTKEDGAIYRGIQVTILNYLMESALQMGICEK